MIAGEPTITTAGHPRGALLRAYDKRTGKDAGSVLMDAPQTGSPMTYMWRGKQYIIVDHQRTERAGPVRRVRAARQCAAPIRRTARSSSHKSGTASGRRPAGR